jgi:hypothetical protein
MPLVFYSRNIDKPFSHVIVMHFNINKLVFTLKLKLRGITKAIKWRKEPCQHDWYLHFTMMTLAQFKGRTGSHKTNQFRPNLLFK